MLLALLIFERFNLLHLRLLALVQLIWTRVSTEPTNSVLDPSLIVKVGKMPKSTTAFAKVRLIPRRYADTTPANVATARCHCCRRRCRRCCCRAVGRIVGIAVAGEAGSRHGGRCSGERWMLSIWIRLWLLLLLLLIQNRVMVSAH